MKYERQSGAAVDPESAFTPTRPAPGKVPLTDAVQRKASGSAAAAPSTVPILAPAAPAAAVEDPFGSHLIGSSSSVVQLKEEPTEPVLLSAGQVAMATSFYKSQPDLYPTDVIEQIQNAVTSPETGDADADMVQGVARFQKSDPTPANKAKAARLLKAYQAYHDLPTENDAFGTAGDMEMTWDELSVPPP